MSGARPGPRLVFVSSVNVGRDDVISWRKLVDGVGWFAERWAAGAVEVLCEPAADRPPVPGVQLKATGAGVGLVVTRFDAPTFAENLRGAAVVYASTYYRTNHVAAVCRAIGVPCVYGVDSTLGTRLDIVRLTSANALLRFRRIVWELDQERRQRRAMRLAAGVQCNGFATASAYARLAPSALCYLDSHVSDADVVDATTLGRRLASLPARPLRLAYSGRLEVIKGVHYLPRLAAALRRRGVAFELSISGVGSLQAQLAAEVQRLQLQEQVHFTGLLDFRRELLPRMRQTDLFVCSHPQGDPSCTYLETMACGVPIIGYANTAWSSLCERAAAGWTVPIGDVEAMAEAIVRLDRERTLLAEAATRAVAFAREHTVECTFDRRAVHLRELARIKP